MKAQVNLKRELYKENGQLVKELDNLRTNMSEGVCAERNQHPQQASILTNQQGTHDRLEENTGILTSLVSFLWDYLSKGVWESAFVLTSVTGLPQKFHPAFITVTFCFNLYLYLQSCLSWVEACFSMLLRIMPSTVRHCPEHTLINHESAYLKGSGKLAYMEMRIFMSLHSIL